MNPSAGAPSLGWVRLGVVPIVSSALLTWAAVGDVSEPRGTDPPMLRLTAAEHAAVVLGLVGAVLLLAVAVDVAVAWWTPHGRLVLAVVAPSLAAGALVGFVLRVVSAHTVGANIGGGLVVLAGPPVFAVLVGIGWWNGRRLTRRREAG